MKIACSLLVTYSTFVKSMLITPFSFFFSVVSKEDWESSLPEGSLEVEKKPEELPNTPVNKVVKRSTGVNRITILYLYINRYSTGTIVGIYTFISLVNISSIWTCRN